MEWKIADMPFLSITHYQSLEKSVSIQSLIHWFKLSLRLRIDDCHYEKINKAFAQTHTGRVGSAARTAIAVPSECTYDYPLWELCT